MTSPPHSSTQQQFRARNRLLNSPLSEQWLWGCSNLLCMVRMVNRSDIREGKERRARQSPLRWQILTQEHLFCHLLASYIYGEEVVFSGKEPVRQVKPSGECSSSSRLTVETGTCLGGKQNTETDYRDESLSPQLPFPRHRLFCIFTFGWERGGREREKNCTVLS